MWPPPRADRCADLARSALQHRQGRDHWRVTPSNCRRTWLLHNKFTKQVTIEPQLSTGPVPRILARPFRSASTKAKITTAQRKRCVHGGQMGRLALDPWTARGWLRPPFPHKEHARERLEHFFAHGKLPDCTESSSCVGEQRLKLCRSTDIKHSGLKLWHAGVEIHTSILDIPKTRLNSGSSGAGKSSDSAKADASFIISLHTGGVPGISKWALCCSCWRQKKYRALECAKPFWPQMLKEFRRSPGRLTFFFTTHWLCTHLQTLLHAVSLPRKLWCLWASILTVSAQGTK